MRLTALASLPASLSQDLAKDLAILAREIHDVAGEGDPQSGAPASTVTAREQVRPSVRPREAAAACGNATMGSCHSWSSAFQRLESTARESRHGPRPRRKRSRNRNVLRAETRSDTMRSSSGRDFL